MLKSPEEMKRAIIENLPGKTGKSLEDWIEVLRSGGPTARKEAVAWLKQVHGLGHIQAGVVVEEALKPAGFVPPTSDELVDAQYAGPKAALRPIYERLKEAVQALGPDALLDARKTYVTLLRKHKFGQVQATTQTRVDLLLTLPGVEPGGRLKPSGLPESDRTNLKVGLASPDEVDAELVAWLRQAYELNG